jgi:hypothetical protein
MTCDACKDGYIINNTTGRESICTVCEGSGVLESCNNYSAGNAVVVLRSTRCVFCGVTRNNHKVAVNA